MCRCLNGRCNTEQCQCKKAGNKCRDCWCVLCNNRQQEYHYVQIQLIHQQQSQYSFTTSNSNIYSSPTVIQNRLSNTEQRKKKKKCGCKSSQCKTAMCGCRKAEQYCGPSCLCPQSCYNQPPKKKQSELLPPVVLDFSAHQTPSPINSSAFSKSPIKHQPKNELNQVNLFPRPATTTLFPLLPQPSKNQQISLIDINHNLTKDITLQDMMIQMKISDEHKCCTCVKCDVNCACLKQGECCTQCTTQCKNKLVILSEIDIPNSIRI